MSNGLVERCPGESDKLKCPWCPRCFKESEAGGLKWIFHVASKHPEHLQEAAEILQGMGAAGITGTICSNPCECLGICSPMVAEKLPLLLVNLSPIILAWILIPLYMLRTRLAYLAGTILSIWGFIYTFAFPTILDARKWYLFTEPVKDFPFVILQIIFIGHAATSVLSFIDNRKVKYSKMLEAFGFKPSEKELA